MFSGLENKIYHFLSSKYERNQKQNTDLTKSTWIYMYQLTLTLYTLWIALFFA